MRPRLNMRLLLGTAALLALAGTAALGVTWYRGRPENLFASASRYFDKGEAARQQGDAAAAQSAYQYSDAVLRILLDKDKAPGYPPALLLRHKVLNQLAALAAANELKQGNASDGDLPSTQMATEAKRLAFLAAADPTLFEAQAAALNYCFRDDLLTLAVPYADNVLRNHPKDEADFPRLSDYLHGAHFILAREALRASPPRPDAALEHLETSNALLAAGAEPRWRVVGLEVQARRLKIAQVREASRPRPGTRPPGADGPDPATELVVALGKKIEGALERVRRDKDRVTPATEREPERAELAKSSPTDARGLFDFLTLSLQEAATPAQVLERANLLVEACEVVVAKSPPPVAFRVAAHTAADVSWLLSELPEGLRPRSADRASLNQRIETLSAKAVAAGITIDPTTFLRMADLARAGGNAAEALRLADKGLAAAAAQRLPEADPILLDLHSLAAWMLLILRQPDQLDEHLKPLLADKDRAPSAHLLRGLAAVADGRLERGSAELRLAMKSQRVEQTVFPHLGLAHAYLGQGRYGLALTELNRIEGFFKRFDALNPDERAVALQLLPDPATLRLARLRCQLGLGRLDVAQREREAMREGPEGPAASLLVIEALRQAALEQRRHGHGEAARDWAGRAANLTAECRQLYPDHAGFVAAEARLLLEAPGGNADAVRKDAESRIHAFAFRKKDLAGMLLWARWLGFVGRRDEAREVLKRLEEVDFPEHKRTLRFERARLELAAGRTEEVAALAKELEEEKGELAADVLLVASEIRSGNARGAEERLEAAVRRHGASGRLHLWQGQLAQSRGDFARATASYERALEFKEFRGDARAGLLTAVLALAAKETPPVAAELAAKLRANRPDDPAIQLARAQVARMLDEIGGRDGMETALEAMKAALTREEEGPAGCYLAALCWLDAGRPDVSRRELDAALKLDPRHAAARRLAGRLALLAGDHESCLRHAVALAEANPNEAEAARLRGDALMVLGRVAEAEAVFRALAENGPNRSAGYRGLVLLCEQSGRTADGLRWAEIWWNQRPGDLGAVRAEIRLLTRQGETARAEVRAKEAVQSAGRLAEQALDADKPGAELAAEEKERRRQARLIAPRAAEVDTMLAIVGACADGGDLDRAESWAERAIALAGQLPEAGRTIALAPARQSLAEVLTLRLARPTTPEQRTRLVEKLVLLYQADYQLAANRFTAGNNLAYLLQRERGDTAAALAIVEGLRKGRFSGKPLTGDRLPLEFLDTAGEVYRGAGLPDKAVALFQEASRRYTDEPTIYMHLGRSCNAAGKLAEARDALARAARLAEARAGRTADANGRAKLEAFAANARGELAKLGK